VLDNHFYPNDWGVRPILFHIGEFEIQSYSFFVLLGLIVGLIIYFHESKKQKSLSENGFFIATGALIGGTLGAKILSWLLNYKLIIANITNPEIFFSGRTIVGGLIGGTIGAILTKKILKVKEKRGNLFAPAIALGVAIGRIGCFFRGCCYGQPTNLPWGVDFGDGIFRHPTQLYESLFMLLLFIYLEKIKNKNNIKPGQLFQLLMISYFIFRFFIEFIRFEQTTFVGLTLFQIISIGVIIYLFKHNIKNLFFKQKSANKK
jgi:phosphatidylglycerol:prolipoprotein diacylglycerol transferase